MTERVEKLLEVAITQLGQLIDIGMLNLTNPDQQQLLDYAHNVKGVLLSDLTEEELSIMKEEMRVIND